MKLKLFYTLCLSSISLSFLFGQMPTIKPNGWTKLKSELKFTPSNISLGLIPSINTKPDPSNFTLSEFGEYQASSFDAIASVNVWRNLNLRFGIGMLNNLKPDEYFESVLEFDEVEGIYDDINGGEYNDHMLGIGGSPLLLSLGVSRSLYFGTFHLTPFISSTYGTYQENYIVDGYEVIASGQFVNEKLYTFISEPGSWTTIGVDLELNKLLLGISWLSGEENVSSLGLRLGYKL